MSENRSTPVDNTRTSVEQLTTISDKHSTVTVHKVETPKGGRLALQTADETHEVRLDAVLLECLTSEPVETFENFLEAHEQELSGTPVVSPPGDNVKSLTTINNEFAHAKVGEMTTAEPNRLVIIAPKRSGDTSLNATALRSITYSSVDILSDIVRRYMEGDEKT